MAPGRLLRALYRAATSPAARRAYRDQLHLALERRRALARSTFSPLPPPRPLPASPFTGDRLVIEPATARHISARADLYLAHRFHLLGSGWLSDRFAGPFPGLDGVRFPAPALPSPEDWFAAHVTPANRPAALQLAAQLDPSYQPIDWHTDRKTGFRFDPRAFHRPLAPYPPGADPKMPWELARGHHLPVLALAARLSGDPRYAREIRNQILDFAAANPPAFGLHWADGLEIAIRAANWILALHLLTASGFTFEPDFYRAFDRSIADHARLQARYLPWEGDSRGNHYLGSLAGLLFASAWLPESAETNGWLAFALAELATETLHEFHPDGSHFEAATAYHLFCADILAWSLAGTAAIPADRLDRLRSVTPPRLIPAAGHTPAPLVWSRLPSGRALPVDPRVLERLPRIAAFLRDVTRPDGQILQIGDCDSGRLFGFGLAWTPLAPGDARAKFANLTPPAMDGLTEHWEPQPNDPTDVLAALGPLLSGVHSAHISSHLLAALIPGPLAGLAPPAPPPFQALAPPALPDPVPAARRSALSFPAPPGGPPLTDQLSATAYPDFGLYLYRSPRLFLAIRCSNGPGPLNRGHAHNDELGIEVWIDGQPRALDPGTFVYTRLAAARNRYRAAAAHFVPHCEGHEPRRLSYDLFRFAEPAASQCLIFGPTEFLGRLDAPPAPILRHVRIADAAVEVIDTALADPPSPLRSGPARPLPFSPAYGVLLRHPPPR